MTTSPAAPPLRADAAERARTTAGRSSAALCVRGLGAGRPLAHATTGTGTTYVLVPTGGEVDAALADRDDLTAVLMVSDRAPVPLRDPLRAQVWLSGWLTPVPPAARIAASLAFAETRPVGPLLDVGQGATLLRLDVAEVVLREGERCTEVGPQAYAEARRIRWLPSRRGCCSTWTTTTPRSSTCWAAASRPATSARGTFSARSAWTASATGCASSARPAGATCACPSRAR